MSFFLELMQSMGYLGVFFLMTIESSFVPFPSEVVVPPAAYLASKGEMNVYLVVLAGLLGSLAGASINYFIARWLGRPVVYALAQKHYMKYLLITKWKIQRAEEYFVNNGAISTFIGRLIPGIRQLISLPAGFSRMNFGKFLFYTGLGSGLWVCILAVLGYQFGNNQELLTSYYREISAIVILGSIIVMAAYFGYKRLKSSE